MVELENVGFGYGQETLFQNTNLALAPGNIYGLLGLNGAGKTTLLQLIAGLLFPDEGRIRGWGYEPAQRSPGYLSRILMLSEELNVPGVTGSEYVAVRAPFYPYFDHQHLQRCMDVFDISISSKLTSLSHGQQKKFLISFGLACKASLLVLDEPTNGLDIPSKTVFRRLVAESLNDDQIFLISTHQVHDVEALIDNIVMLYEGNVLFNRGIDEITDKLSMSQSNQPPEQDSDLLYSESTMGGFATVRKNAGEGNGSLDLELLFKAAIDSPDTYKSIFE